MFGRSLGLCPGIALVFYRCLCLSQRLPSLPSKPSRLIPSLQTEHELWDRGYEHVIGVDEVGRGPLAGSVVAAAVCIPLAMTTCIEVADSKKLSEKMRNRVYEQILADSSIKFAVSEVNSSRIDEVNILEATMEAMTQSVCKLCEENAFNFDSSYVLVDGDKIPRLPMRSKGIVGGDAKVYSIAMASIIAKVTRDRSMVEYDHMFPQFGFAKHKGYPTKDHLYALHKFGPCSIHRLSFKPLKGRVFTPPIEPVGTGEGEGG